MTTVWVVTAGEYSAHHVVGVFATRELAAQTAAVGAGVDVTDTNGDDEDSWGSEPYEIVEYELGEVAWQPTWQCRARVEVAAYVKDGHPVSDRWPVRYGSAKYGWYAYHPHPQPVVAVEEPQRFDYDPMDPGSTREDFRWGYYSGEEPHDVGVTVYSTDPERARKVAAERAYQVAAEWDVQVAAAHDRGELR